MAEKWKSIKSYESLYQVSSLGRVKSLDVKLEKINGWNKFRKGRILKPSINRQGYSIISLSKDGDSKSARVHRLVADAFKKNPKNKPQVNHKNGIKTDNRAKNLEWSTRKQNMRHAKSIGLIKLGQDRLSAKLSNIEVIEILNLIHKGATRSEVAQIYNISLATVSTIQTGRNWSSITGIEFKKGSNLRFGDRNPSSRAVVNCRGEVFKTTKEAAIAFNLTRGSNISSACKGKVLHAGKYSDGTYAKWNYVDEHLDDTTCLKASSADHSNLELDKEAKRLKGKSDLLRRQIGNLKND